jgi:nicotinamidase-related amidase
MTRRIGLTIVYIRTTHSEWTDTPSWIFRTSQKSGLSTCREGSWGAEFYEGIVPLPSERVVIKHRYSGFINTDLNTVLKARNVQSVLVGGVATNVCVETTARDAYMFDYYVTMIEDCSAAYDAKLHMGTLENMRRVLAWSLLPMRLSTLGKIFQPKREGYESVTTKRPGRIPSGPFYRFALSRYFIISALIRSSFQRWLQHVLAKFGKRDVAEP